MLIPRLIRRMVWKIDEKRKARKHPKRLKLNSKVIIVWSHHPSPSENNELLKKTKANYKMPYEYLIKCMLPSN